MTGWSQGQAEECLVQEGPSALTEQDCAPAPGPMALHWVWLPGLGGSGDLGGQTEKFR